MLLDTPDIFFAQLDRFLQVLIVVTLAHLALSLTIGRKAPLPLRTTTGVATVLLASFPLIDAGIVGHRLIAAQFIFFALGAAVRFLRETFDAFSASLLLEAMTIMQEVTRDQNSVQNTQRD